MRAPHHRSHRSWRHRRGRGWASRRALRRRPHESGGEIAPPQRMLEQQRKRPEHRSRIRGSGPGEIGRRAVHRLEDPGATVAEAGGRGQPEPAGDRGCDVREDVAEHVLRHHDVDRLGCIHELHCEAVDESVANLDIGIVRRDLLDDAPPHARGVEHVCLVDRHERAATAARQIEAAAHDARDMIRVVLARVEHGAVGAHAAGAEVQPADQLAHDQKIDPALRRRAQVRVDVECLAQPEKALLGPHRAAVPARAADRAQQHSVRGAARLERRVGQRLACRVDRRAPKGQPYDLEVERKTLEHPHRLLQHLRADPVARQSRDHVSHGRPAPASRGRGRR